MEINKREKILIGIIIVLAIVLIYFFIVKPAFDSNNIKNQNIGINATINYIAYTISQQGYIALPVGNQTLILVPYNLQQNKSSNTTNGS